MFKIILIYLACVILLCHKTQANSYPSLMPFPQEVQWSNDLFLVDSSFTISLHGAESARLLAAAIQFNKRLDNRILRFICKDTARQGKLRINIKSKAVVKHGMDETYQLKVAPDKIEIFSNTDIGAIRALETLLQLLKNQQGNFYFQCCNIQDAPRFPWRGLLIDVCRHFIPKHVILRNIDAMAAFKMNVLHMHLSEDQGFRVESKKFPKLHQLGSKGQYFTQQEIKDIVQYADNKGIRVIPEFDLPGHSTAWFVGYPEFASLPGPYKIEKHFGVFDPTFNPADEKVYAFLDTLFSEMTLLFPDEYFHIGGDENNGKQWDKNPDIQKFIKENKLTDNHGLQAYFNKRLHQILTKYHKKMMGWDEIMTPQLPNDITIQSWRGRDAMMLAAQSGIPSLLSNNFYIDLCQPTWFHYQNDPLPDDTKLTEAQKKFILGGEATMWSELVSEETIDSRIWPRTAAIAERLWSSNKVNDAADMYLRLQAMELLLEELGIAHRKNQQILIRRFLNGNTDKDFEAVLEMLEPVENYARHGFKKYATSTPLCQLPDIAQPDCQFAIQVFILTEYFIKNQDKSHLLQIQNLILEKQKYLKSLIAKENGYIHLASYSNILKQLDAALILYDEVVKKIAQPYDQAWYDTTNAKLNKLTKPVAEAEPGFFHAIKKLLDWYGKK